jgi:hypothetical protein
LQAGSISGRGYHDPPRVGRNRLASVQRLESNQPTARPL